jgi:hypothetical protein
VTVSHTVISIWFHLRNSADTHYVLDQWEEGLRNIELSQGTLSHIWRHRWLSWLQNGGDPGIQRMEAGVLVNTLQCLWQPQNTECHLVPDDSMGKLEWPWEYKDVSILVWMCLLSAASSSWLLLDQVSYRWSLAGKGLLVILPPFCTHSELHSLRGTFLDMRGRLWQQQLLFTSCWSHRFTVQISIRPLWALWTPCQHVFVLG